ncbi:unnamed protein product [Urochloa humidicola]
MPKTIRHDAHKEHLLVLVHLVRSITGKGYRSPGAGPRYRCNACDFDLHELCATAPGTASFFYGQHPLAFEPEVAVDLGACRVCDICDAAIRGMHYSCRPCGFDAHPVCSQLPGAAISPLHPEHLVMLSCGTPEGCRRCGADCVWRYRCGVCGFNLHPRCLLGSDAAQHLE